MRPKVLVAMVVIVAAAVAGPAAPDGGIGPSPARAQQPAPVPLEKGVKTTNLVTSLGAFRGTANVPIVLTGQVVTIEPGGQTGRQRHMVPSYIYVLEGTLTTHSAGGPVGVAGVQYHTEGQSYMDPVGEWHNHSNTTMKPVRYLLLLISTPGAPALTQRAGIDD